MKEVFLQPPGSSGGVNVLRDALDRDADGLQAFTQLGSRTPRAGEAVVVHHDNEGHVLCFPDVGEHPLELFTSICLGTLVAATEGLADGDGVPHCILLTVLLLYFQRAVVLCLFLG